MKIITPAWQADLTYVSCLESSGSRDVCLLHEGELDLPPPESVMEATRLALAEGWTRYDDLKGLLRLREQLCQNLAEYESLHVLPEDVLISNGSSQAIFQLFQCVLTEGDRVIVPSPAWLSYEEGIRLAGGVPVRYECMSSELNLSELRELARGGAKMLVVNSPHNPTGVVLSRRSMEGVVALAAEYDVTLLSDEAYHGLAHGGVECASARSARGAASARIVTSRTFSKAYSMTGFRVGYIYGPSDLIDRVALLQSHVSDHVCTFSQHGALAAAMLPERFLIDRSATLQVRMEVAFNLIKDLLPCPLPQGGFYLFPDVRGLLGNRWPVIPPQVSSSQKWNFLVT